MFLRSLSPFAANPRFFAGNMGAAVVGTLWRRQKLQLPQASKGLIFGAMSVTGKIKNGVVVLPPNAKLPEGAKVKVEPLLPAGDDALVAAVKKFSRPRPHLPKDYALNHGHYVGGEPRK